MHCPLWNDRSLPRSDVLIMTMYNTRGLCKLDSIEAEPSHVLGMGTDRVGEGRGQRAGKCTNEGAAGGAGRGGGLTAYLEERQSPREDKNIPAHMCAGMHVRV